MKEKATRVFCYEEELGIIVNKQFIPIKLEKMKFMRIIVSLMHKKDYVAPDMLLKDAIVEYTSVTVFSKNFKNQNLSDSLFYAKWKNLIKNNKKFSKKQLSAKEKQSKWRESTRQGQKTEASLRQAQIVSIIRSQKRNRTKVKKVVPIQ